jgi:signal peptidase II
MKLLYIQLMLGLFQADLAVKHEIETNPKFDHGQQRELASGRMRILRFHNHGMAGGRLQGHMKGIIRWSGILTIGTAAAFLRLLRNPGQEVQKTGFAMLLGGALSNLYDRCRRGYVVDYVNFKTPWKKLSQLIFNLADFFILIGAILICLGQTSHSRR